MSQSQLPVSGNTSKAYSFGAGWDGRPGHGGDEHELVPRLIEGVLVGVFADFI